jgi:hypothetical protein
MLMRSTRLSLQRFRLNCSMISFVSEKFRRYVHSICFDLFILFEILWLLHLINMITLTEVHYTDKMQFTCDQALNFMAQHIRSIIPNSMRYETFGLLWLFSTLTLLNSLNIHKLLSLSKDGYMPIHDPPCPCH